MCGKWPQSPATVGGRVDQTAQRSEAEGAEASEDSRGTRWGQGWGGEGVQGHACRAETREKDIPGRRAVLGSEAGLPGLSGLQPPGFGRGPWTAGWVCR